MYEGGLRVQLGSVLTLTNHSPACRTNQLYAVLRVTPSERRVWLLTPSRALVDVVLAGTSGEPAAEPATYEGWVLTGAHRQLLEHLLETLVAPGPPHKRIDDTGGEAAGHIARLGAPEPV